MGKVYESKAFPNCIVDADGREVAVVSDQANRKRAIACWNACDGVDTWLLESSIGSPDAMANVLAAYKRAVKACRMLVEYDAMDDNDDLGMMLSYADALEACKEAVEEANKHGY